MSKVALVTGGTRGIGAAVSVALKAAGYTVAANYAGNDAAAAAFSKSSVALRFFPKFPNAPATKSPPMNFLSFTTSTALVS